MRLLQALSLRKRRASLGTSVFKAQRQAQIRTSYEILSSCKIYKDTNLDWSCFPIIILDSDLRRMFGTLAPHYNTLLEKFTDPASGVSVWIEKKYLVLRDCIPIFLNFADGTLEPVSVSFAKIPPIGEENTLELFHMLDFQSRLSKERREKWASLSKLLEQKKVVIYPNPQLEMNIISEGLSGSMFAEKLLEKYGERDS